MLIAGRVLVLLALLYAASCSAWGCSAPAFAPGLQHAGPTSRVVQGAERAVSWGDRYI